MDRRLHQNHQHGFTLLELLLVIGIIAILLGFGVSGMGENRAAQKLENSARELASFLRSVRQEAFKRSTTTRHELTWNGTEYVVTSYAASIPTTDCTSSGSWTVIQNLTFALDDAYEVTGSGLGNGCFYRDGTSSGVSFQLVPRADSNATESADITIIMATGYIDVQ